MIISRKIFIFLVIFFIFGGAVVKAQKAGDLKIEPYVFESASKEKVDAEIGRLLVPENRKKANSRLIELVFVRFKSTSANPKSPIIYLAGGPGSSGIGAARGARFPMFMALRRVADVIVLDQRGVGQSKPNLICQETFDAPLDKWIDEKEFLRIAQERSSSCRQKWVEQGVDLTGYNTNEDADDVDDLRKALGATKINLLAISYGTHLALATLKRHDKNIDQAILAGVEGPDQTYKLPSNIQLQLEAIGREMKTDEELNKKVPDFLALMKRVLDKLEKNPGAAEVTNPQTKQKTKVIIGKFDIQLLTASVMGDIDSIRQLPAVYYAMDNGDFSIAAQQLIFLRSRGIGSAMSFMMDCASGISKKRFRQIESEAKNTLLGNAIDFPFPGVCSAWKQNDLGDNYRRPVKTSVPTLFISGTLDGRTPISNAEEARRGFSNSRSLIIERASHSDDLLISSPKIAETMVAFFNGEKNIPERISLPLLKWRKF